MKRTFCDNHPGRDATATLSIRVLRPGSRPLLLGLELPRGSIDLCDECMEAARIANVVKLTRGLETTAEEEPA